MDAKPFPAFGYVILKTKLKAGEVINDEMMQSNLFSIDNNSPDHNGSVSGSNGSYIWMMLKGIHTYTNINTGEVYRHERGWCNLNQDLKVGMYEFAVVEDSEYICFSPRVNQNRTPTIPKLEYFHLNDGEVCELKKDTKLYLLDGSLDISGVKIPSMRQINLSSGNKLVKAFGDCLGYIFNT